MKRLSTLLLALLLVVTMTSCGNTQAPKEVATGYLQEVQKEATESVEKVESGDVEELNEMFQMNIEAEQFEKFSDEAKTAWKDFMKKLADFDFEVKDEKIAEDEKTATVTVSITTYNLGEKFQVTMSDLMTNAFALSMSGKSEDEIVSELITSMFTEMNKAEKDYKKDVTLTLENTDDGWEVNEDNEELTNALTGGMVDVANQMTF